MDLRAVHEVLDILVIKSRNSSGLCEDIIEQAANSMLNFKHA